MSDTFKDIMLSVILLVLCLLMLPIVIEGVQDALAITGISSFNGVEAVLGLVPLLVVVGFIFVAILNGIWTLKGAGMVTRSKKR